MSLAATTLTASQIAHIARWAVDGARMDADPGQPRTTTIRAAAAEIRELSGLTESWPALLAMRAYDDDEALVLTADVVARILAADTTPAAA